MKVCLTADIHFGVPGRLNDILWACRVMREYCKAARIEKVIILGDLFHDRRSLEIDVLCTASKFFEETFNDYDQEWIVFPGNHDMFLRHSWGVNSLQPLRKHLTVVEDIKQFILDGRRFWILPFIQYEKSFMKVLRKVETQHEEGDILLTHVGVRGATLNTCFLLKDWSIISFEESKFSRVYTGHFHSMQNLGDKVYYPGSPIPFKFDEGDVPHGFYVYDTTDNNHKFINIWKAGRQFFPNERLPPQFYTINDSDVETLDDSIAANNLIRVSLNRDYTFEEKRVIKDILTQKGAADIRWMNYNRKITKTAVEVQTVRQPHANLFESWLEIDSDNIKDLDVKLLRKINDDVVNSGDELYSIEESESD